jgi:AraC-like DNA-binding protein
MEATEDFFHYLPVHEESMRWGAYVTGAGRATIAPNDDYPPKGHPTLYNFDWRRGRTLPEFQILLISDGAGVFESEPTGIVEFEQSTLLFLFPGVWHRYRPVPEVGWTERWLSFNGELVHRLLNIGLIHPRLAVTRPQDAERITRAFESLLDRIHDHPVQHSVLLSLQALGLISDAVAHRVNAAFVSGDVPRISDDAPHKDPIVEQALELVWSHCHYPLSVNDIARQLPITRRTLDRRFSESLGHSVLEEINMCRLSRAKRLLLETMLPVKTVAHLAGFSSTERMRVAFVEREGSSPTAFREQFTRAYGNSKQPETTGHQRVAAASARSS